MAGRFREDLFYRLAVFPVRLPALRERGTDIFLLASFFVERYAKRNRKNVQGFSRRSPACARALSLARQCPRARERVERAIILEDDSRIELASLPPEVAAALGATAALAPVSSGRTAAANGKTAQHDGIVPLEEEERRIIRRALELSNWNIQEASRRLRIGRATIYRKIERYGLMRPSHAIG